MRSRVRSVILFVLVAVLVSACQVDLSVKIRVDSDSSGLVEVEVQLDPAASAKLPTVEQELRTADLVAAGWDVTGPFSDDEGTRISASKEFGDGEQLQLVLDEITGPRGMFTGFVITREAEFAERRFSIDGLIDLRRGIGMLGDAALTDLLGGESFGRPLEFYLEGQPIDDVMTIDVDVSLPGEGEGSSGARASYTPRFDDLEPRTVRLQSVDENFLARVLKWIGTAAFALFGLSVILGVLAFGLEYRAKKTQGVRRPRSMRSRVPGSTEQPHAAGAQQPQPGGPRRALQMVCLDPLGVLYNTGPDSVDLLTSFIRSRGSNVARSKIDELHTLATMGRMSTAEFWDGVEVKGAANDLDEAYVQLIEPRPGAAEFLREMRRRDVPVTCLTNDLSVWSRRLRERDNLAMVWPWTISADVGVRKPDPGIFEALRREARLPYEGCLMIDTDIETLDTARSLGMSTAFFATKKPAAKDRPNHPVVTTFSDFFRRRS